MLASTLVVEFWVDPQRRAAVWLRWPSAQSAKVELQTSTWSARGPMTEERLVLAELLEKAGESDFLRAVAEAVLQLLMESDVEGVIGAGRYERSGERTTWRNGFRDRGLDTRLGKLQLRIPKLRQGSYFPPFLEARKGSEKALVAVIQEAWIGGVSTRRVDDLVQAMGLAGISKSLSRRGLRGLKLVISDAHEGLKAAIRRVFGATWQRCRVHWMRNALAYVPKSQQNMAAAALRQAFIQPDRAQASQVLRHVADQLRQKWPKLAAFIDDSETDVLSHLDFPEQHRAKVHSTNPLERLNKEVKRRADVVGIFPNEASIVRLIGAVLLEQNDEWLLQHRYMQIEGMAELTPPLIDADPAKLPPMAA